MITPVVGSIILIVLGLIGMRRYWPPGPLGTVKKLEPVVVIINWVLACLLYLAGFIFLVTFVAVEAFDVTKLGGLVLGILAGIFVVALGLAVVVFVRAGSRRRDSRRGFDVLPPPSQR